jgi:hypothetical protein
VGSDSTCGALTTNHMEVITAAQEQEVHPTRMHIVQSHTVRTWQVWFCALFKGSLPPCFQKKSFAFESCWPRKHDVFESECFKFYDCHFVFWEFSVEFMECWLRATVSKVCWDVLRLIHGSVCHLKSKLYLLIVCLFCFCGVITRAYCTFPYSGAFSQCILWSYSFCGPWIYKLKN